MKAVVMAACSTDASSVSGYIHKWINAYGTVAVGGCFFRGVL